MMACDLNVCYECLCVDLLNEVCDGLFCCPTEKVLLSVLRVRYLILGLVLPGNSLLGFSD